MKDRRRRRSKTEEELADELYARRHKPDEWAEQPEDIEVRPARTAVVSFRLPKEEFLRLNRVATQEGESLSDFIREAISLRLSGGAPILPVVYVSSGTKLGPQQFTLFVYAHLARAPWTENRLVLKGTEHPFFVNEPQVQDSIFGDYPRANVTSQGWSH